MKHFFLYFFTGTATLYPLLLNLGFASGVKSTFAIIIAIGYTILYLMAANVSLFLKKEGAVLGLITFSSSLLWFLYLLFKVIWNFDEFQWLMITIVGLFFFTSYVVLYSYRSVFVNQKLKWRSRNDIPTILKYILISIQVIIFSIIF